MLNDPTDIVEGKRVPEIKTISVWFDVLLVIKYVIKWGCTHSRIFRVRASRQLKAPHRLKYRKGKDAGWIVTIRRAQSLAQNQVLWRIHGPMRTML